MTNKLLENKKIILTGVNGQLGRSAAKILTSHGAKVIGFDVGDSPAPDLSLEAYRSLDIRNTKQVKIVFQEIFETYSKIDCLVNNAGVSTFDNFEDRSEEDFDWVMDVNLKGTFFCIQNFVNCFDQMNFTDGVILNIASFYGVISPDPRIYIDLPRKNAEVYGASKAGVIQMTKYFAVHLADRKIRVNCISPGGILNPESPQGEEFQKAYAFRNPMKRMADQEEIVSAFPFLLGKQSSYINGINLVIDGGMSCW